jgi:hypothetical protein
MTTRIWSDAATLTWTRELPENATLRLPSGRNGVIVRVVRGSVLVTQEGDPDDHVLGAGEELRLARTGLAVAWALSAAAVVVREGRAAERRPRDPARAAA